ncbi:hypothetical protein BH18ACI3_BH18ACI3_06250 [soil metagenome]
MKNKVNNFYRCFISHVPKGRAGIIRNENGTAMVIALLIMILLLGFVALAISRTTSETVASSNDAAESRAFDAAHASLEIMTRNFNKIFEVKLNPDLSDEEHIKTQKPPVFEDNYDFLQDIDQTADTKAVLLTEGQFQGLTALQDKWELNTTATDIVQGVQVQLKRRFLNNRIPIFQFGIFYDDDLEFHPGPRFNFGGRVHSNGSLFLASPDNGGLYFSSKVSAKNHVYTDVQKNGFSYANWGDNVHIRNASGNFVRLRNFMGSALQTPNNGSPVTTNPAPAIPLPTAYANANWPTDRGAFQGNLLANQKSLDLPLKLKTNIAGTKLDLVELVKRGKAVGDVANDEDGNLVPVTAATRDDKITASERYYNKTGIRVNIADSKTKLPGCAAAALPTNRCGIRLEGKSDGLGLEPPAGEARGYLPRAMRDGYQATRINGERFFIPGRQMWIKIETVIYNAVTQVYDTVDITEDILSLGVTERAPMLGTDFIITETAYSLNGFPDSRSIIKLQRFMFAGASVPNTTGAISGEDYLTGLTPTSVPFQSANFTSTSILPVSLSRHNYVLAGDVTAGSCATGTLGVVKNGGDYSGNSFTGDNRAHWKNATVGPLDAVTECVVPFPINMFDTREGLYNDTDSVFNPISVYAANVPWAGVMSMVDIDVANLKNFLDGDHNARMPNGLVSADIPQPNNIAPKSGGWVFYVSDRRGDYDFDGEYDMEDIFGNNDGVLQPGEDLQKPGQPGFGVLQTDFINEAVRYTGAGNTVSPDIAAVFDHKYYRRGVRLVRGQTLPGIYDTANPKNTKGFTVASENAVYVQGNYNASGVASVGDPTPHTDYIPLSTSSGNIPASVVADAITILSNNWRDANSFASPFDRTGRTASQTFTRFAMIGGDSLTSLHATPNQGGDNARMSGGVHNFKRFLENWTGDSLFYSGSLVNLFNSRNNNGAFKCCERVYRPPNRNWVFDATFLDINRLPPGTPFFQSIQITGFQRVGD